jgi:hypothetical protein
MQVFSQIKQNPYKKALILWVFDGDFGDFHIALPDSGRPQAQSLITYVCTSTFLGEYT